MVEGDLNGLLACGSGVVQLVGNDGNSGVLGSLCLEGQGCHDSICLNALKVDKADGDSAFAAVDGDIVAQHADSQQLQSGCVEGNGGNAVVCRIAGSDVNSDGFFLVGNGCICAHGHQLSGSDHLVDLSDLLQLDFLCGQLVAQSHNVFLGQADTCGVIIVVVIGLVQTTNRPHAGGEGAHGIHIAGELVPCQQLYIVVLSGIVICSPEHQTAFQVIVSGIEEDRLAHIVTGLFSSTFVAIHQIVVGQHHARIAKQRAIDVHFLNNGTITLDQIHAGAGIIGQSIAGGNTNQIAIELVDNLDAFTGDGVNGDQVIEICAQQATSAIHIGSVGQIAEEDINAHNTTLIQVGNLIGLGIHGIQMTDARVGIEGACVQSAVGAHGSIYQVVTHLQHIAGELGVLGQLGGIELGEPNGAVLVPNNTVQIHIDIDDLNTAGSGEVGIRSRGSSNHCITHADSGHGAVGIHGNNVLVGGGPNNLTVHSVNRENNSGQLFGVSLLHGGSGLGDLDFADFLGNSTDLELDLIGGGVLCIVINLQQEAGAVDLAQIQSKFHSVAGSLIGISAGNGVLILAVNVKQSDTCNVLVIGSDDLQDIVLQVNAHVLQLGSSMVNDHGNSEGSALTQSFPIHIAFVVHIVLQNSSDTHVDGSVVGDVLEGIAQRELPINIVPCPVIDIVVGRTQRITAGDVLVHIVLAGLGVHNLEVCGSSVTDGGEAQHAQSIAGICADGVTLGHIDFVAHHGVAAEPILGTVGILVENAVGIILCEGARVQIGNTGLSAVGIVHLRALIEHRGIGPVAVEAQHGDGVGSTCNALLAANAVGVNIALDVGAVGVVVLNGALPVIGDLDCHIDLDAAISGNSGQSLSGSQEQVGIVRVNVAIGIKVSLVCVGQLGDNAGSIVQQSLAVQNIHNAVAIEVGAVHAPNSGNLFTVNREGGQCADQSSGGVHVRVSALISSGSLDEEVSRQIVQLIFISQVVDGEGEGVLTGAIGIVAQLSLDLAIGIRSGSVGIHHQIGICHEGCANICKACALLQDGVVAGCVSQHGNCGGHQQALCQLAQGQAGSLHQALLFDVLCQKGSHTCNLGCSHGSTAHSGIVIVTAVNLGNITNDGVNQAAGGSDLGLHDQRAGNAPAGEGAHGIELRVIGANSHFGADVQLAGPVPGIAGFIVNDSAVFLEELALSLQNGNNGSGVAIAGQIQTDRAFLVVDNDNTLCAQCNSSIGLFEEGGLTTVAQDDLALQQLFAQSGKLLSSTDVVQENVFLLTGDGCQRRIAVIGTLSVEHHVIANGEIQSGVAGIVDGSNTKGVGEGSGRTAGVHADIIGVQQTAGSSLIRPSAGVAGGHNHHNTALIQRIQDSLVFSSGVASHTGSAGTQGQVHRVSAQDDCVFDSGQVVSRISAAVSAEDLHDQQLCIGSNALHIGGLQCVGKAIACGNVGICTCDTGNVRTVLTVIVAQVQIFINVAKAEGNLAVEVQVLSGCIQSLQNVQLIQNACDLLCIQQIQGSNVILGGHTLTLCVLSQRVQVSICVKSLVQQIQAGIDDSDTGTCAGVAGSPSGAGAGLLAGGSHVGVNAVGRNHIGGVEGFDNNGTNAGHSLDLLDLAIGDVSGDQVGCQGQIPDNIQLIAGSLFDLIDQLILILFQALTILLGKIIGAGGISIVASLQSRFPIQENGYTDRISVLVGVVLLRKLCGLPIERVCGNAAIVNLGEDDICSVCRHCGNGQRRQHRNDHYQSKHSFEYRLFFHFLSSSVAGYLISVSTSAICGLLSV